MEIIKTETNPRWEQAQWEMSFRFHPQAADQEMAKLKPLRYEKREDIYANKPIPPLLITYEDGSTEETFDSL